jgi:hypothetical protein
MIPLFLIAPLNTLKMIKVATWNIEHFNHYFNDDNSLKTSPEAIEKFEAIASILNNHVQADLIGIVEAPNTTTTTGNQNVVEKLENFASAYGLSTQKAITGFPSRGTQELAILYDEQKMTLAHQPEGSATSHTKNVRFDKVFHFDADDDKIKEIYQHYRPPFEVKINLKDSGEELWLLLVHAKSKGIFNAVDRINLERISRRNRLKLYAECTWIRQRIEHWLEKGRKIMVMGDINDGPGMDLYEMRYGRSAVEIIMGDIFEPKKLLINTLGRPKYGNYGWVPASASFRDRITEDFINVLIDHILLSQDIKTVNNSARVWNPFQAAKDDPIRSQRDLFLKASDHFPVSVELNY